MNPIRLSEEVRWFIADQKLKNVPSKRIKEDVARRFHRSISYYTIRKTWERYQETGSIEYYKPLGRPRIMNKREERNLVRDFVSHPGKSIKSTIDLQSEQPIASKPVSRRTVRRVLKRHGLVPRTGNRGKEVCIRNRKKRLQFAIEYSDWTREDWSKVVFSDECTLYPKRTITRVIWSYGDAPRCPPYEEDFKNKYVNVWGYLRSDGEIRLFRYEGTMDKNKYLKMLQDNLQNAVAPLPRQRGQLFFMQDGASYHTAKKVDTWLSQNHRKFIVWPPQSPDLSLMENVWARLKNELWNQRHRIKNSEDTWRLSREIAQHVTLLYIHNLYSSLPERLEEVRNNNGNRISY